MTRERRGVILGGRSLLCVWCCCPMVDNDRGHSAVPQLEALQREASKVEELQDALEQQTLMLEEVSKGMSYFEEDRAAELRRAVERFKELEAALHDAEKEVSPFPRPSPACPETDQPHVPQVEKRPQDLARIQKLEAKLKVILQFLTVVGFLLYPPPKE